MDPNCCNRICLKFLHSAAVVILKYCFRARKSHLVRLSLSTRQNSSRMHTAQLETVRASVSVATTRYCGGGGGGCPQMNTFEQVSCDHHKISLVIGRFSGLMYGEKVEGGTPLCDLSMMQVMLPTAYSL